MLVYGTAKTRNAYEEVLMHASPEVSDPGHQTCCATCQDQVSPAKVWVHATLKQHIGLTS